MDLKITVDPLRLCCVMILRRSCHFCGLSKRRFILGALESASFPSSHKAPVDLGKFGKDILQSNEKQGVVFLRYESSRM